MPAQDFRRFLRTPDAASFLGVSPRTLEKLRLSGDGPQYCRPAGRRFVLYDVDELAGWMRAGRRRSTSDAPGDAR